MSTVLIGGKEYDTSPLEAVDLPRPLDGLQRANTPYGPADWFVHLASRRLFLRLWDRESDAIVWTELTPRERADTVGVSLPSRPPRATAPASEV